MRYIFLLILLYASVGQASLCDVIVTEAFSPKRIAFFEQCALGENNDFVQAFLGHSYLNGENGVPKNVQRGLLFYHLSAENGNASSQIALAKQLLKMDENDADRAQLKEYLEKISYFMKQSKNAVFDGSILHPYTLLMLAAEKPEQKWFYASEDLTGTVAGGLLKNYVISKEKKQEILKEASSWKQKKMFEAAREIYSPAEYQKFENTVKPKVGRADAFSRQQAVEKLKKDIKAYKEK